MFSSVLRAVELIENGEIMVKLWLMFFNLL